MSGPLAGIKVLELAGIGPGPFCGMMLADIHKQAGGVVKVTRAQDILDAQQARKVGFLPTVEHLAIGNQLHRVDVLYGIGVRLAGLTNTRKSEIGDGQYERTDCGLSVSSTAVIGSGHA